MAEPNESNINRVDNAKDILNQLNQIAPRLSTYSKYVSITNTDELNASVSNAKDIIAALESEISAEKPIGKNFYQEDIYEDQYYLKSDTLSKLKTNLERIERTQNDPQAVIMAKKVDTDKQSLIAAQSVLTNLQNIAGEEAVANADLSGVDTDNLASNLVTAKKAAQELENELQYKEVESYSFRNEEVYSQLCMDKQDTLSTLKTKIQQIEDAQNGKKDTDTIAYIEKQKKSEENLIKYTEMAKKENLSPDACAEVARHAAHFRDVIDPDMKQYSDEKIIAGLIAMNQQKIGYADIHQVQDFIDGKYTKPVSHKTDATPELKSSTFSYLNNPDLKLQPTQQSRLETLMTVIDDYNKQNHEGPDIAQVFSKLDEIKTGGASLKPCNWRDHADPYREIENALLGIMKKIGLESFTKLGLNANQSNFAAGYWSNNYLTQNAREKTDFNPLLLLKQKEVLALCVAAAIVSYHQIQQEKSNDISNQFLNSDSKSLTGYVQQFLKQLEAAAKQQVAKHANSRI